MGEGGCPLSQTLCGVCLVSCVPCLVLWRASRFKGSLTVMGPPFCSSRFVAMVFLNAIVGEGLHIFAYFCNISLFFALFCMFMHCVLCVAFVPCVAPCMVHGIGMHVMHHIIIMCSSSCSSCSSLIIIDHHHVHRSLFIDQSLNIDCCSLINVDHLLCERE